MYLFLFWIQFWYTSIAANKWLPNVQPISLVFVKDLIFCNPL